MRGVSSDVLLESEVVVLVARLTQTPPQLISPTTSFTVDLGVDSVQALEVVLDVEEYFGCKLPGNVLRDIRTVGDLVVALRAARRSD